MSGGVVEDLQGGKITYPNSLTIIEPGVFFSYRKTHESTSNDEAMFKDYIKQSVVDAWFGGGIHLKLEIIVVLTLIQIWLNIIHRIISLLRVVLNLNFEGCTSFINILILNK
ncbi:hypothetical protein SE956_24680 [Escherichia coli]|nr:hypothetical protein [Escherichia coli]